MIKFAHMLRTWAKLRQMFNFVLSEKSNLTNIWGINDALRNQGLSHEAKLQQYCDTCVKL